MISFTLSSFIEAQAHFDRRRPDHRQRRRHRSSTLPPSNICHCQRHRSQTLTFVSTPSQVANQLRPTLPFASNPRRQSECLLADVVLVCDWWFFILFVIGNFVWSGLRKKIGDLGFFFFCCGLLVLVMGVVVAVVVVGAVDFFWSVIYYFIVVVILFYCDVYIILLC